MHEEFLNPEDVAVKWRLAQSHWCRGEKGLALERLIWISKRFPNLREGIDARSILQGATESSDFFHPLLACRQSTQ
jgi:hypothetical protein